MVLSFRDIPGWGQCYLARLVHSRCGQRNRGWAYDACCALRSHQCPYPRRRCAAPARLPGIHNRRNAGWALLVARISIAVRDRPQHGLLRRWGQQSPWPQLRFDFKRHKAVGHREGSRKLQNQPGSAKHHGVGCRFQASYCFPQWGEVDSVVLCSKAAEACGFCSKTRLKPTIVSNVGLVRQ